jgi:hypothetical protein
MLDRKGHSGSRGTGTTIGSAGMSTIHLASPLNAVPTSLTMESAAFTVELTVEASTVLGSSIGLSISPGSGHKSRFKMMAEHTSLLRNPRRKKVKDSVLKKLERRERAGA